MRFVGGKPFSREESWRHIAFMLGHWQLRGYGMWAAEEKASRARARRSSTASKSWTQLV